MKIIGWIRYGDKAACGGTVVEGEPFVTSHGRPLAPYGARMACRKNCVIAQATPSTTLPSGRGIPHHGHITSGGCPLISTLNDIDGVGNQAGEPIATAFFQNAAGEWTPKIPDSQYDEKAHVVAEHTEGVPYYIETTDGRVFKGTMPDDGELPRIDTYGRDTYTVLWGDEALAKQTGEE